ncbi:dihydrofolate reductase family protein [Cytobacillus kochii]|nr:dihydrofolate reductase family protein [Cytobacillus kochii]MDM5206229.1 dihydrofolate reductase family protein [Cytobacillus kochii]
MMRKVVLYIAQSLDGYIATKEDSLEWLFSVESEGDNGYGEFINGVDTILIGKRTYDWVMEQEKGEFPYKDKECFVFSRSVNEDTEYVKFIHPDIKAFTNHLKNGEGKSIWLIGGGDLLYTFLQENLVDEMIVTVAPRIIGEGIPLFKAGDYQFNLSLKSTRTFNQFVELHYVVKR